MSLREVTGQLVHAPDAAVWLRLADSYIQSYNKLRERFVLPSDHARLKPIVDAFASDSTAFIEYVKAIRDAADGLAKDEINQLYRTLSIRSLQVTRRTRLRRAALTLLPQLEIMLERHITYDEQMVICRFIEQLWGAMRLDAMSRARDELKVKRLSSELRNEVLEKFWKDIDKKLDTGVVELGDRTINDFVSLLE